MPHAQVDVNILVKHMKATIVASVNKTAAATVVTAVAIDDDAVRAGMADRTCGAVNWQYRFCNQTVAPEVVPITSSK